MSLVEGHAVHVVVALPAHAGLSATLTYRAEVPLDAGTWVRVPLGKRAVLGLVWDAPTDQPASEPEQLRAVIEVMAGFRPFDAEWRNLMHFTAHYYQRSLGDVVLSAIPPLMRDMNLAQWERKRTKFRKATQSEPGEPEKGALSPTATSPGLTSAAVIHQTPSPQQAEALDALRAPEGQHKPVLLQGVTGSGKTEVYLQRVAEVLATDARAQALVLVPEINLTPQLLARFTERFSPWMGSQAVVALHSGLSPAKRMDAWLAAHMGLARIVLGTRTAVLCSMPGLRLIVVDEEHDPSYKAQDGARYSARDLAVYRAHALRQGGGPCQVLLGSATPSLETWHAAQQGRYLRLRLSTRQGNAQAAKLRLVDMASQPRGADLAPALVAAISDRAACGEQSLLLLNRRGYAPVLSCGACGWKSHCPHCTAYRVFHKVDRSLRCHHCGHSGRVPQACPDCGNLDIQPVGKGTQQLEESVSNVLGGVRRPDGSPLRVARLDADTARTPAQLETQLEQVHSGAIDVLVGTQMVAKGHDFRRITLVAALNADSGLFASDYRAPERLFALLMQAAGRAGRDAALRAESELWVQTWNPGHRLFQALKTQDVDGFAASQLAEREAAGLPPFVHQALLRAEARQAEAALVFLQTVRMHLQANQPQGSQTWIYPPIAPPIQRVANVERMQMLLESPSRSALHQVLETLGHWATLARNEPGCKGLIRWAVDVDPLGI